MDTSRRWGENDDWTTRTGIFGRQREGWTVIAMLTRMAARMVLPDVQLRKLRAEFTVDVGRRREEQAIFRIFGIEIERMVIIIILHLERFGVTVEREDLLFEQRRLIASVRDGMLLRSGVLEVASACEVDVLSTALLLARWKRLTDTRATIETVEERILRRIVELRPERGYVCVLQARRKALFAIQLAKAANDATRLAPWIDHNAA